MTVFRDNCVSYNKQLGEKPEIPLAPPSWSERTRPIMIDACMAATVQAVWDAGFVTLGSCCGHGGKVGPRPSLVLESGEKDYEGIRAAIATVDDREYELLQWRLCEVGK